MKKLIAVILALAIVGCCFVGCNKQTVDFTWHFDRVIIFLPNGEKIESVVRGWTEFDGSDMIQVTTEDATYLTHSSNVVLISES